MLVLLACFAALQKTMAVTNAQLADASYWQQGRPEPVPVSAQTVVLINAKILKRSSGHPPLSSLFTSH
jgi:hypothetical protein